MLMEVAAPVASQRNSLVGRITDVDSHEMVPLQLWTEYFGEDVKELGDAYASSTVTDQFDKNSSNVPSFAGDTMEITDEVINKKGCTAPGAVDIRRRLEVMDRIGVNRQLMYPTSVGLWAVVLLMCAESSLNVLPAITHDRAGKAKRWVKSYNRWLMNEAIVSDRIRPVPPLVGETVDELMTNARDLIDAGARAVWIPAGTPPGGRSPAHPDLDPFWQLLAESNCAATLHLGTESKLLDSIGEWRDAPAFEGYRQLAEFSSDPWFLSMLHVPCQNFLSTMINGGVFERHPGLRFGVIEVGAYWLGPMMEALDLWHKNMTALAPKKSVLRKLPSDYVRSNVRVSVFSFEDIDTYIERYGLEDVLCFASDYPHVEGGKNVIDLMYDKVSRLGPEVVEKFFVSNGQFLLPD